MSDNFDEYVDNLSEAGGIGAALKNFGSEVGQRVGGAIKQGALNAAGKVSDAAKGAADATRDYREIVKRWREFAGEQGLYRGGDKPKVRDMVDFLTRRMGFNVNMKDIEAVLKSSANDNGGEDTQQTIAKGDPADGTTGNPGTGTARAANPDKPAPQTKDAAAFQHKMFNQIATDLKSDQPNRNEILGDIKQLIGHAGDRGGQDQQRMVAFLKAIKKNPENLRKVPQLRGIKLEHAQRLIDAAILLVEGAGAPRTALLESVRALFEDTIEQMPLSRQGVTDILKLAAKTVARNGKRAVTGGQTAASDGTVSASPTDSAPARGSQAASGDAAAIATLFKRKTGIGLDKAIATAKRARNTDVLGKQLADMLGDKAPEALAIILQDLATRSQ